MIMITNKSCILLKQCEFRLSKNYSIPKSGQLNVTLMNPQGICYHFLITSRKLFNIFCLLFSGIVVQMFFVSYDMRDMPAMSQTFIRQRMLATDDRLRYTIHLRYDD